MRNLIFGGAFIVILGMITYSIFYYTSVEHIEIKILEKEQVTTGTGESLSSKYLIFAEGEVFENTDEFIYGKFNSSDYQSTLKVDSTYNVKVIGWRIPFLSSYRNIIEIN